MSTNILSLSNLSPGQDIDAYLHTVSSFPILTPAAEKKLADRFYYENDVEAARELVLCHLRFVAHMARTYSGYGLSQSDLIQEGNLGLMKAVKRFDPERGVRLVSFAVHWIKAEIHDYILRNWRIVKVATTKAQRKLFFNLRGAKKHLSWLTVEETNAIAKDLGVSPKEVTRMESRLSASDLAYDVDDGDKPAVAAPVSPSLYLKAENADPADLVAEERSQELAMSKLGEELIKLDERSRDIVQSRWLTEPKATLQQLATRYDVSAERIRQIESNAFKKLQRTIAPLA
jgi:RNA polymerase sigma-32 factor